MKNQWTNFFFGYVKIKVEGKGVDRFLNECVRNSIEIWDVKKNGADVLIGLVFVEDIHKIRKIIRNQKEWSLRFIGRNGLPFLLKQASRNIGLVIGFIFFFIVFALLSNIVWSINISGGTPEIEHEIRKELDKIGIEKGKLLFTAPDVQQIQNHLLNQVTKANWIGVDLNGTAFEIQVVENKTADETGELSPRHLVATKKAIVTHIFVEQGQPQVAINDYVEKGDILVSGIIGKEDKGTEKVAALGEVMGETWYLSTVTVPLKTNFDVYTGTVKTNYKIKWGIYSTPIWGFKKPEFKVYNIDLLEKPLYFLSWKLPITFVRETYREKEEIVRSYTFKEAVKKGIEAAREELRDSINEEAEIKGEKVLHHSKENGKVKLELHFQVIENIAKEQPIIEEIEDDRKSKNN